MVGDQIFFGPPTLTGQSFAAPWAITMKSGWFERPKPYLLTLNLKKQHNTTYNICKEVLKSANLLHKRGLDDYQLHITA